MKFNIIQNDITNMMVNAIVLPANEKLKEGRGTSKAIFSKAGRKELTKTCHDLGSCKLREAVPTLAFKLDADYIIHAVVPKWIDGKHQEYDYLSAAYLSTLNVADIMGCEPISFPMNGIMYMKWSMYHAQKNSMEKLLQRQKTAFILSATIMPLWMKFSVSTCINPFQN